MINISNAKDKVLKYIINESTWFALILVVSINYIMYVFFNDGSIYWSVTGTICAAVTGGLSIVSIMKNNIINKSIIRFIGLGCIFIALMTFFRIVLVELFKFNGSNEVVKSLRFTMIFYDYIVVFYSFYGQRNNINKRKAFVDLFLLFIIDILLSLFIIKDERVKIIFTIVILIISWIRLKYCDTSEIISEEEKDRFIFSFIMGTLFHLFFIASEITGADLVVVYGTLRCIAYVNIYVMVENIVLNKSYNKVKRELTDLEKSQVNLNKVLMERNKSLTEAELLIKKSEDRYKNLINSIKDGIVIIKNGKITFTNDFIIKMLSDKSVKENIANKIIKKIRKIRKNQCESGYMVNIGRENVNNIFAEVYYVKMNDNEEVIYIKDVTEINIVYDVRKRYSEYVKMEESKNEFYSNISHELRTPITLIYSALQLNDIYIKNKNIQGIKKNNKAIRQNCLRLIRTITNFIDANKVTEGYLKLNLKVHNIVSLVENIATACNEYIRLINDNLVFDSEEEEIYVKCDKDIMERVIMNIISNIVKYGEPNGNIYINVEIENKNVIIIVRVDNYTIKEEYKKYMFDKFSKLNKEFTRTKEGSGLGLFLVKEFLELNGGSINVETNKDLGTSFIITMPIFYGDEIPENEEEFEIKSLKDKVDTEFSDIYL